MKAFLLAAGLGTRLRPITSETPKCLVPVNGVPLLAIWLDLLQSHGVDEVLMNTHYLADQVAAFTSRRQTGPHVTLAHEAALLGSAGTLEQNWDFVAGEESFLVCYADNLTDIDLTALLQFHRKHDGLVTMTLFHTDRPTECGIVELDQRGRVIGFEEKPAMPKSSLANGGVYVMRQGIHDFLPGRVPADIGFDLLPSVICRMYGWQWPGLLADIGNHAAYRKAQEQWANRNPIATPMSQLAVTVQ